MAQSDSADRGEVDTRYMRMALRLALRGAGRTSPNPMVGAVLARGGEIIATGYHRRAGTDHAEIVALKRAGGRARGATLYLNLEPCSHFGRTPPCADAAIRAGVKRVVIGMADPNPLVSGRGIRKLRQAGIRVHVGLLSEECRSLNEAFCKYITRRCPFVILKLAASLDGKTATATGDSQWITDKPARRYVHRLRNQVDAVLVGAGTVIADDPQLTCRIPGGRNPLRVVVDGRLRIPTTARLLREPGKSVVVTGSRALSRKVRAIKRCGAEVWRFPLRDGGVPFTFLLRELGKRGIVSVMIEGGAATAARAMKEKVVDQLCLFYAPQIVGGDGKSMMEALGITKMGRSLRIKNVGVQRIGRDILVTGYL